MLRWWWAAIPLLILTATAALQSYWLQQLHAAQSQQRESYLQRATFLFASELDYRLSLVQAQLQKAGANVQTLQAEWQALEMPDLVQAIWIMEVPDREQATLLSRNTHYKQPIEEALQSWVYGYGTLQGMPPLLLHVKETDTMVAVVWNRDFFATHFLPWCFERALSRPQDFRFNLINAATQSSLMGQANLDADGSSQLYPPARINSPYRETTHETWHNPYFNPETARLHFGSTGVLRLETRLAEGSLAMIEDRQFLRDSSLALFSSVFLALTFFAFYTYLRRAQALSQQQAAMMAAFSHELRTPLATIGMAGENLADATVKDEDKVRAYGRLVTQESNRLRTMVMQVLQYSKLFSRSIEAKETPFRKSF